ncbi:MAG: DNA repair protein RecO [Oscillospiraceae bacterium]
MEITTEAIVIKEKEFKGDRILVLLSKELGVITAYARGAKRPKSKFASSTELFCYSRFILTKKGENFWVDYCDVNENFFGLRQDILKLSVASYLCEISTCLAPKEEEAGEYLRLLLNSLEFLIRDKRDIHLIKALFELRILTMAGFMPALVGCDVCGVFESDYMYFSPQNGKIICDKCFDIEKPSGYVRISMGILAAMRHIIYSPFEKLFAFTLSQNAIIILSNLTESYTLSHIDFLPQTLTFLKTMIAL